MDLDANMTGLTSFNCAYETHQYTTGTHTVMTLLVHHQVALHGTHNAFLNTLNSRRVLLELCM